MSRGRLAALAAVAIAIALHARCGGDARSTAATTAIDPAARGRRADLVVLAAAVAQLQRRDVAVGHLRLLGRTVDPDGVPIGGTTITLNGARTTTSAGDGLFEFPGLAEGDYSLTAEQGNYYGEMTDHVLPTDVEPDRLIMRDGPTVTLHVVDRNGLPIFGAKVECNDHNDGYTDRDGVLRERGASFGFTRFSVSAAGYASQDVRVDAGDDPRRSVEHHIVLQPAHSLGGIVVGPDDKLVGGVQVTVQATSGDWSDSVAADGSGHWQIAGFGPGNVAITASGGAYVSAPDQIISLDDSPHTDLVVRVELGASIGGIVVDAAGNPIAKATVDVDTSPNVETALDGTFLVAGVGSGDHRVNVTTEKLGAAPQHVLIHGSEHAELRFQLAPSSISGIVVDGQGKPAADVVVHADGAMSPSVRTDETGHFDLEGIPPGSYVLTADRMETTLSDPKGVKVQSGDHDVRLEIPDSGSITGRVVMNGTPVDYFGVAIGEDSDDLRSWPMSDPVRSSDGRFTKTHLWPRRLMVAIVGPGFERKVIQHVAVPDGGQIDLGDIAVSPGRVLRGHVVDESGAPVADAAVIAQATDSDATEVSLDHDLYGSRGVRSDAAGAFELAGLPADAAGMFVQASTSDRVAAVRQLTAADLDADVRIVVQVTGSVDGTVHNASAGAVSFVRIVSPADPDHEHSDFTDRDGHFHFDLIPPGDYVAKLADVIAAPVVFHVAARTTSRIELETMPAPIHLDIELAAADCIGVTVSTIDAGSNNVGFASCEGRGHAATDGFLPGTYELCNYTEECTVAEIAPAPARQTVTIPPRPPKPDDPPTTEPSPSPGPEADPSPSPDPPAEEADPGAAGDEAASPEG